MKISYPLKHWLTVLLIGPFFWLIYEVTFINEKLKNCLRVLDLVFVIELLCSLPVFILYIAVFYLIRKKTESTIVIKLTLNIFAITGMFITFKLMGSYSANSAFVPYIFAIVLCSLIFKIQNKQTQTE